MSMKIWGKRMLALACAGAMLVPLAACVYFVKSVFRV